MQTAGRRQGDGGGVTIWMVLVVAASVVVASAMVRLVTEAAGRGRAQAVADVVALAAVGEGRRAAAEVAGANGAVLVRCDCDGMPRRVVVRVGGRSARATASCQGCEAEYP